MNTLNWKEIRRYVWYRGRALGLVGLLAAGCATSGGLTRADVLAQYDEIARLNAAVAAAKGNDAALLAPEGFAAAQRNLDRAVEQAREAKRDAARTTAGEGLQLVTQVDQHLAQSREVMAEVLDTRERARREGAPGLYPEEFDKADGRLREATRLVERGEVGKARERRPKLLDTYSSLELKALKEGTLAAARKAVEHAEDQDADDHAPRTFKAAEEELKLVTAVIEADRTQTAKANAHARKTIWLARRAEEITRLAREFERQDYGTEDVLLWYQAQLQEVRRPLGGQLPFDKANAEVVETLRRDVQSLLTTIADMRRTQQASQQRIAQLQQQVSSERAAQEALLLEHRRQLDEIRSGGRAEISRVRAALENKLADQARQRATAEQRRQEEAQRFDYVRSLFANDQAEVLRKGDDMVLRLHGFYFPPGGTEIEARNFGLLNKVVSAINTFPDSKVAIGGHTDSRGSKDRNLRISIDRARNVVTFLAQVGGIAAARLSSEGNGETKPVASNDTAEGRAQNRRIEVTIINSSPGLTPKATARSGP